MIRCLLFLLFAAVEINSSALPETYIYDDFKVATKQYLKYRYRDKDSTFYYANQAYRMGCVMKVDSLIAFGQAYLGRSYLDQQLFDSSQHYLNLALLYFQKDSNHTRVTTIENNIGSVYDFIGDFENALTHYILSYNAAIKCKNNVAVANVATNIGIIYAKTKNNKAALEYFGIALNGHRAVGARIGVGNCLNNIGLVLKDMKQLDSAMVYLRNAEALWLTTTYQPGKAMTYNNIGTIYELRDEFPQALEYYTKSLDICKELGNAYGMAQNYMSLGKLYYDLKNFKKAISIYEEALAMSEKTGFGLSKVNALKKIAISYRNLQQYENATEAFAKYVFMNDSMEQLLVTEKLAELEQEFDIERKESQIVTLKKDKIIDEHKLSNQKYVSYALGGAAIVVLLLLGIGYLNYRHKKSSNDQLRMINTLLEEKRNIASRQRDEVIEEKEAITDSIQYAKSLQDVILPSKEELQEALGNYFVFYRPKDIVSGDFYWYYSKGSKLYLAVVDCTGHGVPGALVSMIGYSMLNNIVRDSENPDPAGILNSLNEEFQSLFVKSGKVDGMDLSLICFDRKAKTIQFSGAYNPLYVINSARENTLTELIADKQPIGATSRPMNFTNQTVELQKGDCVYLFTDGYCDQFGGEKGKKFMVRRFRNLLITNAEVEINQQKKLLVDTFDEWKGNIEQVDDVCVLGFKIT